MIFYNNFFGGVLAKDIRNIILSRHFFYKCWKPDQSQVNNTGHTVFIQEHEQLNDKEESPVCLAGHSMVKQVLRHGGSTLPLFWISRNSATLLRQLWKTIQANAFETVINIISEILVDCGGKWAHGNKPPYTSQLCTGHGSTGGGRDLPYTPISLSSVRQVCGVWLPHRLP